MKHKSMILSCVMIFCLVAGVFSANAAYNITLEATTDGETVASVFSPGSDLYLNINLAAGSDGVAGCAFTLTYPSDLLTAPVTNPSNLPDSASSAGITSIFPFKTAEKYTRCENSSEAGKIMFAGAEITDEGGSKVHPWDVTLFTVKFTVKSTASGNATFELMQTVLTNADAGWNGEGVPVIVGAVPNTDSAFGGDLSDDFPVLLPNFAANPTLTISTGDCPYCDWKEENDYDGTGSTPDIGGEEDDYDHDGYSNLDEMNNDTDPYVDNAAGAPGYDEIGDLRVSNLDVDGNGQAMLSSDAMLVIRYMFGVTGSALTDGLVDTANCTRCTPELIGTYIEKVKDVYDVDSSGEPTLSGDIMIIIRYMFGVEGEPMIDGLLDEEFAERRDPGDIADYIKLILPD